MNDPYIHSKLKDVVCQCVDWLWRIGRLAGKNIVTYFLVQNALLWWLDGIVCLPTNALMRYGVNFN